MEDTLSTLLPLQALRHPGAAGPGAGYAPPQENYLPDLLTVGGLTLNRSTYELSWQGKKPKPQRAGVPNPGDAHGAARLCGDHQPAALPRVGWDSDVDCSVVWVHISNIRKKLARLGAPAGIRFLRGGGVCVGGGAIKKGAALGGSFFSYGGKKAPGSFRGQALRETGFSFRNGAPELFRRMNRTGKMELAGASSPLMSWTSVSTACSPIW